METCSLARGLSFPRRRDFINWKMKM